MWNTLSHQHIIYTNWRIHNTSLGIPIWRHWGVPIWTSRKILCEIIRRPVGSFLSQLFRRGNQSSCGSFSPDTADHLSFRESLKTLLHKDFKLPYCVQKLQLFTFNIYWRVLSSSRPYQALIKYWQKLKRTTKLSLSTTRPFPSSRPKTSSRQNPANLQHPGKGRQIPC